MRTIPSLILALSTCLALPGAHAGDALPPHALAAEIERPTPPLVVDVRSEEEYAAGHVPGAVSLPHDRVGELADRLEAGRELVLYCRSGRRSRIAGPELEARGFRVRYLEGDYPAWEAAGLSVARPDPRPQGDATE
ncbi:rhodanese-like domain-containing protein [Coralloluteibacterium thermophilus]|uniref:Rhodanese-like domain-containing protein n=1 Tax=Coralloluteibacterium thermophilum TaxID=2707049 RepID=A0ABV9NJ72_9GAMM